MPRLIPSTATSRGIAAGATAAVAVAAILGLAASAIVMPGGDGTPAPPDQAARPAGDSTSPTRAATLLARIAASVADTPPDPGQPDRHRFEYVETIVWDSDPDPAAPSIGSDRPGASGAAGDPGRGDRGWGPPRWIHTWTTGHDTGHAASRHLWLTSDDATCQVEADQTSTEALPFDGPLPTHTAALRRWLPRDAARSGAADVGDYPNLLGQIAGLYAARTVPAPTRRAVLTLLADLPGLTALPEVRDRAGRLGVAITGRYQPPTPPAHLHTLVIDPHDGHLLASHSRPAPTGPAASAPLDPATAGSARAGNSYQLYLTHTYSPTWQTPAPPCPATTP